MRIKGCFLIFQAATQCSSDAVSFKNLVKGREWTMKMDMEDADMTLWTEADFEEKCTYIVNDHPWDPSADGGTLTQAEASLPRNLTFKYASNCKEVSGNALGKVGVRRAKFQRFGKRALTPVPLFNAHTHQHHQMLPTNFSDRTLILLLRTCKLVICPVVCSLELAASLSLKPGLYQCANS